MPVDIAEVIRLLREMHAQQVKTDEHGGREVAWYYWRGEIEAALGLEPDALDEGIDDA